MVLDIVLFRKDKGGNPDLIRESQRRRFKPVEVVDEVIELDVLVKSKTKERNDLKHEQNQLSKQIGQRKKAKEPIDDILKKIPELKQKIKDLDEEVKESEQKLSKLLTTIGNIVHESVPVHDDEEHNEVVATWGDFTVNEKAHRPHYELFHMIDGFDQERGVKVAGARCYFLKGIGVRLNQALIRYAMDFLNSKKRGGYIPLQTPFFMTKSQMAKTAQLEQFDEELYKVTGDGTDDKYLIATSEQPISAYHANEWLEESSLPLRYCGISSCFRKEAGSSGRDIRGIFRVHQFEKVEQFCITKPEDSWKEHERMLDLSKEFCESLEIPYRVVAIVSGELNNAAAKKYDVEGWFPGYEAFRELVSCSNCTDYQARSLEIRCGQKKKGEKMKKYVHMLNSTLCATGRTMCCLLETHQTEEGIIVPEVLRPYLHMDFIKFVKEPPVDKTAKTKGKGKGKEK